MRIKQWIYEDAEQSAHLKTGAKMIAQEIRGTMEGDSGGLAIADSPEHLRDTVAELLGNCMESGMRKQVAPAASRADKNLSPLQCVLADILHNAFDFVDWKEIAMPAALAECPISDSEVTALLLEVDDGQ